VWQALPQSAGSQSPVHHRAGNPAANHGALGWGQFAGSPEDRHGRGFSQLEVSAIDAIGREVLVGDRFRCFQRVHPAGLFVGRARMSLRPAARRLRLRTSPRAVPAIRTRSDLWLYDSHPPRIDGLMPRLLNCLFPCSGFVRRRPPTLCRDTVGRPQRERATLTVRLVGERDVTS
jgi:hypothetical protein